VVLDDLPQIEVPLVRHLIRRMAALQQGKQLGQHLFGGWELARAEVHQHLMRRGRLVNSCIFQQLLHLPLRRSRRKAVQSGRIANAGRATATIFEFVIFC